MEKADKKSKLLKGFGKKLPKKAVVLMIFLGVALAAGIIWYHRSRKTSNEKTAVNTATVEKRSITSELSASGSLSAKDSYNITSLVEGEVISADFEEGDEVEKDQVLYTIDSSSMETELRSAATSLERAREDYEIEVEDYQEALSKFSGNTYKSTETGYIKTLYIKDGEKVSSQTKIADIYNDKTMKLKVPFLAEEAALIPKGVGVTVTLTDTGEILDGVVISVANMDETMTGGRIVRYVHVQVENPGGLTTDHAAVVTYGDMTCSQEGNFEPITETTMTAEDLSSEVDIQSLLVAEGDYVGEGSPLFLMTASSAEKMIRSYKTDMDKAQESVESAESKLESTQDTYDNYTITAPISGQVIAKNVKVGEKISRNSGSTDTTLAVIYDLSSLTFEMSIDELDISSVKVGQKVNIQADAFENEKFTGTVTNVSLEGSYSNGVTNYPVTVTLDDSGELLPGMNVDGTIVLEEVNDVLTIPVDALMRGNMVYVKDTASTQSAASAGGTGSAGGTDSAGGTGSAGGTDSAGGTASERNERSGAPEGFHGVQVETGLVNDSYIEIKSGLSEGDEVYISQSSKTTSSMETGMPGGMSGMPGDMGGGQGGSQGGSGRGGSGGSGGMGGSGGSGGTRQGGSR